MTGLRQAFGPVDAGALEAYPISVHDRLDSHYFVPWNLKLWSQSTFRRLAYKDPEVGFFGQELFFKSHGQLPLGTLPVEHEEIAFLLGIPLERWTGLMNRAFNPLHNWAPVMCDNGEVRLAHPVVLTVMQAALDGHREHMASNEDKAVWQRRKRLKAQLKAANCSDALIADELAVGWIDDWLLKHHTGQRRMPQIQASIARALTVAAKEGILNRQNMGR